MSPSPYLGPDGLRAVLVLVAGLAQAVLAGLPDAMRWRNTIATRSASLETPVVPPSFTFAIWGPIFLLCGAFAVWQALPGQLADPLVRTVGTLAIVLFGLNALWEAYVPWRGLAWPSVLLIVGELAACAAILWTLAGALEAWSGASFWFMVVPFLVFSGWASVALFVNLSSTLVLKNVRRPDPRRTSGALLLVLVAAALSSAVTLWIASFAYALPVLWAFAGIVLTNCRSRSNPPVAWAAGLGAVVVLTTALVASVREAPIRGSGFSVNSPR